MIIKLSKLRNKKCNSVAKKASNEALECSILFCEKVNIFVQSERGDSLRCYGKIRLVMMDFETGHLDFAKGPR